MNLHEQLLKNIENDVKGLQAFGTPYRANTATLALSLVSSLGNQLDEILTYDRTELESLVRNQLHDYEDDERILDVTKYLFIHCQRVKDQFRLKKYYNIVDAMMKKRKN